MRAPSPLVDESALGPRPSSARVLVATTTFVSFRSVENGGDDTDTDVDIDVVSARHRRGVVTSRRERERESAPDARCRGWCAHRGSFERRVEGGGDDDDDDG